VSSPDQAQSNVERRALVHKRGRLFESWPSRSPGKSGLVLPHKQFEHGIAQNSKFRCPPCNPLRAFGNARDVGKGLPEPSGSRNYMSEGPYSNSARRPMRSAYQCYAHFRVVALFWRIPTSLALGATGHSQRTSRRQPRHRCSKTGCTSAVASR